MNTIELGDYVCDSRMARSLCGIVIGKNSIKGNPVVFCYNRGREVWFPVDYDTLIIKKKRDIERLTGELINVDALLQELIDNKELK